MGFLDKLMGKKKSGKPEEEPRHKGFSQLDKNLKYFKDNLKDCDDVVYREFKTGDKQQYDFALIYVDGLIDKTLVNEEVLKSLMIEARQAKPVPGKFFKNVYDLTIRGAISSGEVNEEEYLDKAMVSLLSGDTLLIIDGYNKILVIGSKGWASRGVQDPDTESVIRGPREGFTETLRINTALIRRRIRDPNLKMKHMYLGKYTKTDIAVIYMENIVNKSVLEEVEKRLDTIDVDKILDSGFIEQFIEDNWYSPFPQIQSTERPDKTAAALLEGRVAIVTDNTPFTLIVPATLNILFQSPEDYNERWIIATAIRFVRYIGSTISMVLPALYIAITSYHPGLIPTQLALYIAGTRSGVPFPTFIEALLMESTLELLREAGVRLPGPIGQTIGIVGGLVIGQAAVEAGLVSPITVIIVALTAIASFAIPSYNMAIGFRLVRFVFILGAGIFGLYGVMLVLLILLVHLCSLKSFGVPYLSPYVSTPYSELKDALLRAPLLSMHRRPGSLSRANTTRMKDRRQEKSQQKEGG